MSETKRGHSFCYEQGTVTITGVKEVKSFSNREVVLVLDEGGLIVRGVDMSVSELDTATGVVRVSGTLTNIGYTADSRPLSFLSRLLK